MHHYQHLSATSDADFTQKAVEWMSHRMKRAIADRGYCIIALSGGSTPRPVYDALGRENIEWSHVFVHLVDERYVPAHHQDSNQRLVRDTLLYNARIPESNLIFPNTSLPLDECVQDYGARVHELWTERGHLTDVCVLGMGDDGHIASLFPPVPAHLMDDTHIAAHTTTDRFVIHDRITLTLNPIAACGSHIFLLTGADKKKTWEEIFTSTEGESRWPAKRILEQEDVVAITLW